MANHGEIGCRFNNFISLSNPQRKEFVRSNGILRPISLPNSHRKRFYGYTTKKDSIIEIYEMPDFSTANHSPQPIFQIIPVWAYSDNPFLDTSGSLYGIAKVHGVILTNTIIRLYYKPNGFFIAETRSDPNGAFHFDLLEVGKPYYTVIAYKNGSNALIADAVSPVKTV